MSSRPDSPHLYAEYAKKIQRYLFLRTGDAELTSDLTQECFARLLAQSQRQHIATPLPYLYTLAGHLLTDHRRRHETWRTGTMPTADFDALLDDRARPDVLYETRRRMEAIESALQRLPQRSREVFRLCRVEGHTHAEAARTLRVSTSSIQKHLALAMRYLVDQGPGNE